MSKFEKMITAVKDYFAGKCEVDAIRAHIAEFSDDELHLIREVIGEYGKIEFGKAIEEINCIRESISERSKQ